MKFYAEIELEKVRERKMPYDFTYIWSIKNNINEQTKQKQTHTYKKQIGSCQRGGVQGTE